MEHSYGNAEITLICLSSSSEDEITTVPASKGKMKTSGTDSSSSYRTDSDDEEGKMCIMLFLTRLSYHFCILASIALFFLFTGPKAVQIGIRPIWEKIRFGDVCLLLYVALNFNPRIIDICSDTLMNIVCIIF